MKNEVEFQKNNTFIFIDNTLKYNAINRTYRSYELNGMATSLFKDQSRLFLIGNSSTSEACPSNFKIGRICKDWINKGEKPKHFTVNYQPDTNLSTRRVLKLIIIKAFNNKQYQIYLNKFFALTLD